MKTEMIVSRLLALILWGLLLFFSLLLSHNAILYFTHGGEYGILPEKTIARKDLLWNIAFYVHLPSGVLCLLAPLFLFTRRFFRRNLKLHKIIGQWYVYVTLLVVCPTGMYLALYAKGGLVTQTGFMVQGLLLAWFTYEGYRHALKGDTQGHVRAMVRSYAVATVVLSFRIFHILFFVWGVLYHDNYAISQWLGLSGNALLAELLIVFIDRKSKSIRHLKTQQL